MLSALLIQLFGRDVIDRLARTGFDTTEAIARAGVDRLSDEGGIPASLARRIIAVAVETPLAAESEPIPAGASPKKAKTRSAARGRKTGAARPGPPTKPDLDSPAGMEAGAAADDEADGWRRSSLDPFVDDVGLVSFMGLAARGGPSSPSKFSVAEEILDPNPAPITPGDPPTAAPPAGQTASRSAMTPAPRIPSKSAPAGVVDPREKAVDPPRERPGAVAVAGSFWVFGTPIRDLRTLPFPAEPTCDPDGGLRGPEGLARTGFPDTPRRRNSDGH